MIVCTQAGDGFKISMEGTFLGNPRGSSFLKIFEVTASKYDSLNSFRIVTAFFNGVAGVELSAVQYKCGVSAVQVRCNKCSISGISVVELTLVYSAVFSAVLVW